MINQLLALARAETQAAQTMPFEKIEITELARHVVQEWVQASMARRIDLGFEAGNVELPISGNPTMLREMLNNLIDNALRYTPALGTVTIRVQADNQQRLAILEVEDTGPGIPPSERAHVFERFYRILGTDVEGSGLGLAIVREIAIRHGVDIELLSNPQSKDPRYPGSLFRICFRLEKSI
jgi:two-component system sensor histidine kinase TctE